ncbi:MAG TPA: deoxyribonuclease IV [Dissulfurispiraceae bacterium]|nr:deoxyribonuclease IV [Dissulfurispiraceae bacterium]
MSKKPSEQPGKSRRLGVHTSIAGGVLLSLERAHDLGSNTMQIFSHNPRQWAVSDIEPSTASAFRKLKEKLDIRPVFVHTSYLINLAAADSGILEKSVKLMKRELDLADTLGAEYVVVHTGSLSDGSGETGRRRAIESLRRLAAEGKWKTRLLLENTAGEKGDITSRMEDLAEIIDKLGSPLIAGITLDTCHAFAAGYDVRKSDGLSLLVRDIEKHVGIDRVKLIHLNDAKKGLGSRVDRHWHIGEGEIGLKGLERLVNSRAFRNIPLILETPKKTEEDDPMNLRTVRGMFDD